MTIFFSVTIFFSPTYEQCFDQNLQRGEKKLICEEKHQGFFSLNENSKDQNGLQHQPEPL